MNHPVEQFTWNCLRGLMLALDPQCEGWCIDAGVGHFDFYCEWMHRLGFRTVAIDPVLSPEAIEVCQRNGIPLIEAALCDRDGIATLYAAPERDLRSLETMWGGMVPAQGVHAVTLGSLIDTYRIQRITALKLDIEGGEPAVISTLPQLPSEQLPLVISFEWGGEWPAKLERGPWQPEQRQRLAESFQMLETLGYQHGMLIGFGEEMILRPIKEGLYEWYFEPDDNWGNAVLTRGEVSIEQIIEFTHTTVND